MISTRVADLVAKSLERMFKAVQRSRSVREPPSPSHIKVGAQGEEIAHFHLRREGYQVVARNWRTRRRKGELDLVAWDGGILCFVEVKTRTAHSVKSAEVAVDRAKQAELTSMAREYMRRLPSETPFRFDLVSVYVSPDQKVDVQLFKNAFSGRRM